MSCTGTEAAAAGTRPTGTPDIPPPSSAFTASTEAPPAKAAAGWHADPYTRALTAGEGPLFLRGTDGERLSLGVERWCGTPDAADRSVMELCEGAVLDIGCGPGRFVTALAVAGHRTLGIDVNPAAVRRTVRQGGPALLRSVFDPVPREGQWNTALLIDGNIGIGGDPGALLARTAEIIGPGGLLVAEVVAMEVDECLEVRFESGEGRADGGLTFPWARLGTRALLRRAETDGHWTGPRAWRLGGRSFVALRRRGAPHGRSRGADLVPGGHGGAARSYGAMT